MERKEKKNQIKISYIYARDYMYTQSWRTFGYASKINK